jgi:uncharacterized membrane protein YphA (DoxX/SURF4 family)
MISKISFIIIKIIAALILLQTLYFKFGGQEESVYIFTLLGMEPWGRIGSGIVELIASILLLIPALEWLGAFLAAATMTGALAAHVTILGIEVMDDGGTLFILALIVFACSIIVLIKNRVKIKMIIGRLVDKRA